MHVCTGAASVARAWSGYVDALAGGVIANATAETFGEMHSGMLAKTPDFLAFVVCLAYCGLSTLGVKGSAYFNSFFTMVWIGDFWIEWKKQTNNSTRILS